MWVFAALIIISIILLNEAFSTRGKEGMFFAFLGAAILLCTLAIGGLRMTRSGPSSQAAHATNFSALAGAFTGLIFGGFFGAFSGFGRIVIAILNPELPERDFGRSFGATGGGLLGAFFLAIAGSVLRQWLIPSQTCIPADQQAEETPLSTQ